MTHGEQQTQHWLIYTKKECILPMQLPIYAHQSRHMISHVFTADLTRGTSCGRLCFNQKRDGLILSSINRSENITVQTQVKRLYIILAASAIPVLIRTDCLKRSRRRGWASSGPQTILLSVQVSYEMDIIPLWTFCKMCWTSITGSWHHKEI